MSWADTMRGWVALVAQNASVTPVPVGRDNDGLTLRPAGTSVDKPWHELFQEVEDAREAWRRNPLARRLVGLVTSYVVGNGITLSSDKRQVQSFIDEFWQRNQMELRVDEWSDELSRAGELFPVLFTNPVSGMSSVRVIAASMIRSVEYDGDDYETELAYEEVSAPGDPPKWWMGRGNTEALEVANPLMLHYAVNRPVGAVRGESDLASILPWLRRYNRWLEDRVRFNAAMRAFLWVVKAPGKLRAELEERYRVPPDPGSVIIADENGESWEAVTPKIAAGDVAADGRAIRWMIVAGGPGTALLDIGEGEDSNLATGQAMAEQRRRFLRRRQAYLVWMLSDVTMCAYQRWQRATNNRQRATLADIKAVAPDISPEDNNELAQAAASLVGSVEGMMRVIGGGDTLRALALKLYIKFLGETASTEEVAAMLAEGQMEREAAEAREERMMAGGEEQEDDETGDERG